MVMDMLFVINAFVIVGFLLIWSFMVFSKKNYTLMEIGWPLSLVLATSISFLLYGSSSIYRRLLVLTVTIWGLRLAFSLYTRHWNQPESRRYARMREKSDSKFSGIMAFGSLFIIPAIIFYIVSLPITIGFLDSQSILVWWQYVGLGLWALGLLIEMGTESQVRRFKSKPENEGQLITKGFWRLSRHPHYFGTALVWWGIFLLSVVDWNNLLGILSPIVMTLYLVYLASRSTIEAEYQEREDLQNYTRKTPQFFPFVTQIAAVLSGIGKMISKTVSSARKTRPISEDDEVISSASEDEIEGDEVLEPVVETTTETAWFKPEIAEDELASHPEEEVILSEDDSLLDDDILIGETDYDESTIEDVLNDNEFANEVDDKSDPEFLSNETESEFNDEAEDIMPLEETVKLIEEEELTDGNLLGKTASETFPEADITEEQLAESDNREYSEIVSSDMNELSEELEPVSSKVNELGEEPEPLSAEMNELSEEPFEIVGEIPGSDIEIETEPEVIAVDVDSSSEEIAFEEEPDVIDGTKEEEKKKKKKKKYNSFH